MRSRFAEQDLHAAWEAIAAGSSTAEQAALRGVTRDVLGHALRHMGLQTGAAVRLRTIRRHEHARNLVEQGWAISAAAKECKIGQHDLSVECRDLSVKGRDPGRKLWTKVELKRAWEAITNGSTVKQQAKLFRVSPNALKRAMLQIGLSAKEALRERTRGRYAEGRKLVEGGWTVERAAARLGLFPVRLYQECRDLDLHEKWCRKKRLEKQRKAHLLRIAGKSIPEIAKTLRVSRVQATIFCKEYAALLAGKMAVDGGDL